MNALDLIVAKRDGAAHTADELRWLMRGAVDGSIPDYQLAAWLMAVVWRGMTAEETAALTDAMAHSGQVLDLSSLRNPPVDKHSTGGVGDKTTLVVAPLAAATGLTVAKMSGRGLGHTGGTLDKLESIPGFSVDLDAERFIRQAADVGLVIAGQTAELAPADKHLYALRDVTGTVPSLPLIAASIMSKKLAAGAEAIALDVKVGAGAFMPSEAEARALAEAMVDLGRRAGRRVAAALTRMDQPLGHAVGNALEVREAIETLQGRGPADLHRLCLAITGLMHVVGGQAGEPEHMHAELYRAITSGRALERFAAMIHAQGGQPAVVDAPDRFLPHAPVVLGITAPHAGWVTGLDARAVGEAAVDLGAGRRRKGDAIDPAVGVLLHVKMGDRVDAGVPLAELHARDLAGAEAAAARVRAAYRIEDDDSKAGMVGIVIGYVM